MTPLRIIFVVLSALTLMGGTYLSYRGIWAESTDLDRSIRLGSGGNTFSNSSVK